MDWDAARGGAIPVGIIEKKGQLEDGFDFELIPTLFITNRTLLNITDDAIPKLSERIENKINEIREANNWSFKEVQIDCDWSQQTKTKYFELLDRLGKHFRKYNVKLSATIRLHQVKFYRETGVPPVDRGMLMFYNVGNLTKVETENSILDLAEAKKYLVNFESYPLSLDVALPIFRWGVLFRDRKMIKLINNLDGEALVDTTRFLKLEHNRYQVIKSTYLQGHYLYEGDLIRLEQIVESQLEEAVQILKKEIKNPELTISFYHLDSFTINNHPYEKLERLIQSLE